MIRFNEHANNLAKIGSALLLVAACGDSADAPDASVIDANTSGTFSLSWSVTDGASPIGCDDVGAVSMRASVVEENSASGQAFSFDCADGMGTSPLLPSGTYRVTLDLRSGNGSSLLTETIRLLTVDVPLGGDNVVEAQTFNVNPAGSLTFRTKAAGTTSNCDLVANGGAGIEAFRFSLRNSANECVNTTFDIAAGGQPAQTYSSDCLVTIPCIEADQLGTVDPTSSGSRRLEIEGLIGDLPCWQGTALFSVPGNGLAATLGEQQLAFNSAEPACTP